MSKNKILNSREWKGVSGALLIRSEHFSRQKRRVCPKCSSPVLSRDWPPNLSMCQGGFNGEWGCDRSALCVCLKCETEFDIVIETRYKDDMVLWTHKERLTKWSPLIVRDGKLYTAYWNWHEDSSKAIFQRESNVSLSDLHITEEQQAAYNNWPKNSLMNKQCQLRDWEIGPISVDVWDDGKYLWPLKTNCLHPAYLVICGLRELGVQDTLKARFYTAEGPDTDTIEGVQKALMQHIYI